MDNPTIQIDLAEILRDIKNDQKEVLKEVSSLKEKINNLKVGQAKIEGKIEALDIKVEQLDKRIGNRELTNRGILIGLVVIILGGAAKLFGLMPNS
ncbi:MAG: hypothetical protein QNJ65_19845 [Xenococcaceae cyanobacterium MO_234.B1]|nr:hypothetical protein [Xenococcaceae cyanobacterium MO_234.B1]